MTKVLVSWSGGCDSTLLLYHACRKFGTPDEPIRALSITADQVTTEKHENAAREKLLKEFKKRGLHVEHEQVHISLKKGPGMRGGGLPQALMWLYGTQFLREDAWFALGYIKGDDWLYHRDDFAEVFKRLQSIGGRTGNLWTPLIWTEKRAVIRELEELELLTLTTWCDRLSRKSKAKNAEPCGECASCRTHDTAVWKLETYGPGETWGGVL